VQSWQSWPRGNSAVVWLLDPACPRRPASGVINPVDPSLVPLIEVGQQDRSFLDGTLSCEESSYQERLRRLSAVRVAHGPAPRRVLGSLGTVSYVANDLILGIQVSSPPTSASRAPSKEGLGPSNRMKCALSIHHLQRRAHLDARVGLESLGRLWTPAPTAFS